jgi:c-di-GMP-binding flagellar brake protein YcgR
MTSNERRHYQRIPFIADAIMSDAQDQWNCVLEDISLKGMLIVSPSGVTPQKDHVYTIELVLGEGATITMAATISHVNNDHWGLQWDNIDLEGLTHLRRLLELNMVDPAEMHRELAELGPA